MNPAIPKLVSSFHLLQKGEHMEFVLLDSTDVTWLIRLLLNTPLDISVIPKKTHFLIILTKL